MAMSPRSQSWWSWCSRWGRYCGCWCLPLSSLFVWICNCIGTNNREGTKALSIRRVSACCGVSHATRLNSSRIIPAWSYDYLNIAWISTHRLFDIGVVFGQEQTIILIGFDLGEDFLPPLEIILVIEWDMSEDVIVVVGEVGVLESGVIDVELFGWRVLIAHR